MAPDTSDAAQPAFLATYLAGLPRPEHGHPGSVRSVREADVEGHHIVIATSYEITVDGRPLDVHIGLSNDGSAHCHGLPAYQLPSLVDLVRVLVHTFPDEFPPPTTGHADDAGQASDPDPGTHSHHDPNGGHDHSEHDGGH